MESVAIDIRAPTRRANRRAYLAGGGVTAALVGAATIIFASLAAYVAFNGLPFGGGSAPTSTVTLASAAPQAAATTVGPTAGAVAPVAAVPSDAALAEIAAALPPAALAPGSGAPGAGTTGAPGPGGGTPGGGPGGEITVDPGALGGVVGALDQTTGRLGLGTPLGDLTRDITAPLDRTVTGTLNTVGAAAGDRKLGDKVNGTVGGLTDTLGSVTGGLLK